MPERPGFRPDGVWIEGNEIVVKAAYNPDSLAPARDIVGRRWDSAAKVTRFPLSSRDAVRAWVTRFWPKLSVKALDTIGAVEPRIEVRENGAFLYIKTPYAKAFVDGMHELPDCEYQRDGSKEWKVPRDRVAQLAQLAERVYGAKSKVLEAVVRESQEKLALATAVKASETIELPGGTLFPFQVAGVQFIEKNKYALIADEMGCIDGDAVISYSRASVTRKCTLAELYVKFNRGRFQDGIPTFVKSMCDGILKLNRVVSVLDKGTRPVVLLTLESGKTLRLTPDHEVAVSLTEFARVDSLSPGDIVLTKLKEGKFVDREGGTAGTGGKIVFIPKEDRVVSVRDDGVAHVYDIVMADPYRNFVAGGVVVHNCGKTVQSIAYMYRNPQSLPAIVVCPASVKENWRREIEHWGGGKLSVAIAVPKSLDGQLAMNPPNVLIINYDQLGKLVLEDEDIVTGKSKLSVRPSVLRWGPKLVVFDEAHYLKNSKAKRSKAAGAIAELTGRRVIELTGTPVLNRPEELWHLLHLIDPEAWGSESKFKYRYCDWEKAWHGHAVRVGAQRLDELHSRVTGHYMVRRLKKDVLKELPDKIRSCVPLCLEPAFVAAYRKLFDKTAAKILSETGGHFSAQNLAVVKAAVNTLRQEIGLLKAPLAAAWVQEALESTDKVVIFSYHHAVTDKIVEVLLQAGVTVARMDGRDSLESRQIAVDAFQNGKLQVLACGILAAGVGLNLTAADQVVFAERAWRPADHEQAEDRLHRIGQKRCVNVWFLDAEGTIDEDVRDLQRVKREAISQTIDGGDSSHGMEESLAVQVALRMLRRFQEKG